MRALAVSIRSFEERKVSKGKDAFDLSDWWKSNCATLPAFAYVLRKVLSNSPKSCPPECLFRPHFALVPELMTLTKYETAADKIRDYHLLLIVP